MKTISIICLLLIRSAFAQTDSLDNIIFKLPNGRIKQEATFMQATVAIGRTVYELASYQQQISTGKLVEDYKKEWNDIVLAFFNTTATPRPVLRKNRTGIPYYTFSSTGTSINNGKSFFVQLNVYQFGNYIQSVIVMADSRKNMQQFDSLYQSIVFKATPSVSNSGSATADTRSLPFSGKWAKSASNYSGIDPGSILTDQGYYKGQYDFNPNGTYVFHGESWGGYMRSNYYLIIDESGRYEVNDDRLTLTPCMLA